LNALGNPFGLNEVFNDPALDTFDWSDFKYGSEGQLYISPHPHDGVSKNIVDLKRSFCTKLIR